MSGFDNPTNRKRVERIVETLDLLKASAQSNRAGTDEIGLILAPVTRNLRLLTGAQPDRLPERESAPERAPANEALTHPRWADIRSCAAEAPLSDFPAAIAVFLNRIDEEVNP